MSLNNTTWEELNKLSRCTDGCYSFAGVSCTFVWTGGWTFTPGSANPADWRWLYTSDVNGRYEQVTDIDWASAEPNGAYGEHALGIWVEKARIVDMPGVFPSCHCYVCEYP